MLRIWIPKFVSEFKPVLAEYDDSGSEDEEDAEFVPVIASFQISRIIRHRPTPSRDPSCSTPEPE